ncbi:hypothetical protein B6N31_03635 [Dickeya fangzhongdai]|nr:hypothetical protein B6N31_03635 [Dickeya fangzhongdai]
MVIMAVISLFGAKGGGVIHVAGSSENNQMIFILNIINVNLLSARFQNGNGKATAVALPSYAHPSYYASVLMHIHP